MRGLDIIVLATVASRESATWTQSGFAQDLGVSQSQVHYAFKRAAHAGLWDAERLSLRRDSFLEFAVHAAKYLFPPQLGAPARGVPTAHAAPPLAEEFVAGEAYVWPYARGAVSGLALEPLHKAAPRIALQDHAVHEILALIDALRVGRTRERESAEQLLRERLGANAHAA